MHFQSPTSSPNSTNNVLLVQQNPSKMSFIVPNNSNSSQQSLSSTNILSSPSTTTTTTTTNSGMITPPIISNGIPSNQQQRLSIPLQRSTSSPQIPQDEFNKILRVLQENNMTESIEILKKEYQSLINKTTSSFSEPYFTALDGYISYVQEQPDTSRHEFSQLIYPLFVHMYLDLIEKDHLEDAQRFFLTYVKNTNLQATVFAAHKDDLFRIKSLTTKEQIIQSEYVKSFRHNGRYWIKLCNASLELLDQFLIKQQKYPLLTQIVQKYFQVNFN